MHIAIVVMLSVPVDRPLNGLVKGELGTPVQLLFRLNAAKRQIRCFSWSAGVTRINPARIVVPGRTNRVCELRDRSGLFAGPEVPALTGLDLLVMETLRQAQIAIEGVEDMLPRPHRERTSNDRFTPTRQRLDDIGQQPSSAQSPPPMTLPALALPIVISDAKDFAAVCYQFDGTFTGRVRIGTQKRLVFGKSHTEFFVLVHLVTGHVDQDGIDVHLANGIQQIEATQYVGLKRSNRV